MKCRPHKPSMTMKAQRPGQMRMGFLSSGGRPELESTASYDQDIFRTIRTHQLFRKRRSVLSQDRRWQLGGRLRLRILDGCIACIGSGRGEFSRLSSPVERPEGNWRLLGTTLACFLCLSAMFLSYLDTEKTTYLVILVRVSHLTPCPHSQYVCLSAK